MVVAYHLGGRLGIECGRRWLGGFLAQSMWENQNPEDPDKRATPHPRCLAKQAAD